jgi:hypothetical protein
MVTLTTTWPHFSTSFDSMRSANNNLLCISARNETIGPRLITLNVYSHFDRSIDMSPFCVQFITAFFLVTSPEVLKLLSVI